MPLCGVMFGQELADCGEAPPELRETSAGAYGVLRATVRALTASEKEAQARALAAWASVYGAVVLNLGGALRGVDPAGIETGGRDIISGRKGVVRAGRATVTRGGAE